jgi:sugar phosphate isomerase/epimerase
MEMAAFADIAVVNNDEQVSLYRSAVSGICGRAVHAPYLGLYPGSPDTDIREEAFACFERVYKAALSLGAGHLIFHHNYDPSACTESGWLDNSCEFWRKYLEGKPYGIKIHLENIMDRTPELISELVCRIGTPNLDIALDIGHVNAYSEVPLAVWIEFLQGQIGYVHLHDNNGLEDEHLALGKGNIKLSETLDSLLCHAPDAIWSIESGGERMYQSVEWLKYNNYLVNL